MSTDTAHTAVTDPGTTTAGPTRRSVATRLAGGSLAAPLYVVAVLTQASIRDGSDITRHPASMLADGFLGSPPGMPPTSSGPAIVHTLSGTVVFLAMIVACFVLARSSAGVWRRLGQTAGALFAAGLVWCYTGGELGALPLFIGVAIAWSWLSASLARLARTTVEA